MNLHETVSVELSAAGEHRDRGVLFDVAPRVCVGCERDVGCEQGRYRSWWECNHVKFSQGVNPFEYHVVGALAESSWDVVCRRRLHELPQRCEILVSCDVAGEAGELADLADGEAETAGVVPTHGYVELCERSVRSVVALLCFVHEHGETGQYQRELDGLIISGETQT